MPARRASGESDIVIRAYLSGVSPERFWMNCVTPLEKSFSPLPKPLA